MARALLTDNYQLTMAEAYFSDGRAEERAVFDYFFRSLPFGSGYAVFAGLGNLVEDLEGLQFRPEELDYLREHGFGKKFLEFLEGFRFRGDLFAPPEGEVVFPTAPIVRVEGTLVEAQLVETLLLNTLNFQTLIATKAARVKYAAGEGVVSEFGLRRAQGLGGLAASRAAVVGGCDSTSNVEAGRRFGVPVSGTMAHSFIQSYPDELTAFRRYAKVHGSKTVLLLDTYQTLVSGLPNAIQVARELRERGERLLGVRLDSGDLAYLSKAVRKELDREGFPEVKIVASNRLDEYVVRSLREQGAPIDVFGVGTTLATGLPDAALDGVYKLAVVGDRPTMKLSERLEKSTLPGRKMVSRLVDGGGMFVGDVIHFMEEEAPEEMFDSEQPGLSMDLEGYSLEPLLLPAMREGRAVRAFPGPLEAARYGRERLERLPVEHRRFEYPHVYRVGISAAVRVLRDGIRKQYFG